MPTLKEWVSGEAVQLLVYGRFKTGKTWGAGTFPRPNFIDFDGGMATFSNPAWLAKYGQAQKDSIRYETFEDLKRNSYGVVLEHVAFDNACRYFDACMSSKTVKWRSPSTGKEEDVNSDMFDTWVIDSGTSAAEAAMSKALILLKGGKGGVKSNTQEFGEKTGLIAPKMQDFGSERSMIEQFVDMVKTSGKHVVFICHEKEMSDEDGTIRERVPLLTGKGVEAVCLKFDEIYRLRTKKQGMENIRVLQTETDGIVKAGSRYGVPNDTPWEWAAVKSALLTGSSATITK